MRPLLTLLIVLLTQSISASVNNHSRNSDCFNQSISQSVNQSAISPPINQSAYFEPFRIQNDSISQPNQSIKRINRSVNQSVNQSIIPTTSQSINQSVNSNRVSHPSFIIKTVPELIEDFHNSKIDQSVSERQDGAQNDKEFNQSVNVHDDRKFNQLISMQNNQSVNSDRVVDSINGTLLSFNQSNKSSVNQSIDQSIDQSFSSVVPSIIYLHPPPSVNQSVNQPVTKLNNISSSSRHQSVNQSVNQSIDQSNKSRSDNRSDDYLRPSISQGINQPIDTPSEPREKKNPIIELKDQVLKQIEEMKKEKQQSINQQTINQQSISQQSINQPSHHTSDESIDKSNPATDEPQSVDQSIDQSLTVDVPHSINQPLSEPVSTPSDSDNQSIEEAIDQSINQVPHIYPSTDSHKSFHDRFNYAASDSGAKLLTASPGMKKASSILVGDDDRYLMVPCQSNDQSTDQSVNHKELVIQLKEDILIQTIELANFEHYSSSIKDFELYGSNTYPAYQCEPSNQSTNQSHCDPALAQSSWTLLGLFHAPDSNTPIIFHLPTDQAVRYIKLRWLTQHKDEYYCTMTYLKVYGVSVLEAFRADLDQSAAVLREVEQVVRGIGHKKEEEEQQVIDQSIDQSESQSTTQLTNDNIDCSIDPPVVDEPNSFWDVFNSWNVVGQRSNQLECELPNNQSIHVTQSINQTNMNSSLPLTQPISHSVNESLTDFNSSELIDQSVNPSANQSIDQSPLASASSFIFSQLARLGQQAGAASQAEAEAAANRIDPNFAAMLAKFTGRDRPVADATNNDQSIKQSNKSDDGSNITVVDQSANQTITSVDSHTKPINQSVKLEKNSSKESTNHSTNQSSRPSTTHSPSQSIFKTLTNRLNELEVHQALSTHFISDLSERWNRDIESIKRELVEQSTIHARLIERSINQSIAIQHEVDRVKSESDLVLSLRVQLQTLQNDQRLMDQQIQSLTHSISQSTNQMLLYQLFGAVILILLYQSATLIKFVMKCLVRVMTYILCWRMRSKQRNQSINQSTNPPKRVHRRSVSEDARTPTKAINATNQSLNQPINLSNKASRRSEAVSATKAENLKSSGATYHSSTQSINQSLAQSISQRSNSRSLRDEAVKCDTDASPFCLKKEEAITPDAAKEEQKASVIPPLERVSSPPIQQRNQPTNQSINRSVNQSINQSSQSKNKLVDAISSKLPNSTQPHKQVNNKNRMSSPVNQSINQSTSQSHVSSASHAMAAVSQSINRVKSRRATSPAIALNRHSVNSFEWLATS